MQDDAPNGFQPLPPPSNGAVGLDAVLAQELPLIPDRPDHNRLNTFINEADASGYAGHSYEASLASVGATASAYAARVAALESSGVLEALGLGADDAMLLFTLADSAVRARVNAQIARESVSGEYMVRALAALRKLPPYGGPVHVLSGAPLSDDLRYTAEVRGRVLLSSGFVLGVAEGLVPGGALTCDIEVRGGAGRARSLALFGLRALVFEPETYFVVEAAERELGGAGCLRVRVRVEPRGFALEDAVAALTAERPNALPIEPRTPYGPVVPAEGDHAAYKGALERRGLRACVMEPEVWVRSCVEYNNVYYRLRAAGSPMTTSLLDWHLGYSAAWREAPKAQPEMPAATEKYAGKWAESEKYAAEGQTATKKENDIATVYAHGEASLAPGTITAWNFKIQSPSKTARGYVVGVARKDDLENGWYLALSDLTLRSGPPHSYAGFPYGPASLAPGDGASVTVVFGNGALAFSVNGSPLGVAYDGIPTDEPLYPAAGFRFFEDRITLGAEPEGFLGKMSSWIPWPSSSSSSSSDTRRVVYAHESEYCDKIVPGAEFTFTEHRFYNGVKEIKAHMLCSGGKEMWAVFLDEKDEADSKDIPSVKARIKTVKRLISKVKANRYSVAQNLPFYIVTVDVIARLR